MSKKLPMMAKKRQFLYMVPGSASQCGCQTAALNPIDFWNLKLNTSLKELAELALHVTSVLATSAGMERAFSHCGIATTGRWHRLTSTRLESKVIIRLNSDFLHL